MLHLFHATCLKPRQMAEVQMKSLGYHSFCQLSFGWGQEWSNEGDRSFWSSWEGTHSWPNRCWHSHPQRPLHCKSGLRKGQAPKGPWTVSLSSPWPASERTLSLCFYFPNHDRKAFRYPYSTPKNVFKVMTAGSSLNQPKTKNQLYHSKDYCHFILQLSVIG